MGCRACLEQAQAYYQARQAALALSSQASELGNNNVTDNPDTQQSTSISIQAQDFIKAFDQALQAESMETWGTVMSAGLEWISEREYVGDALRSGQMEKWGQYNEVDPGMTQSLISD